MYRYEMHCHDCLCSKCAHSLPEEMAQAYYEAGYAGVVFTNHFLRGNTAVNRRLPWDEKVRAYYDAYLRAVRWAEGKEFSVFFGLEHHYGGGKEVLTYGIDLDFLLAHPDLDRLPLREYARLVRAGGGFVAQAHPFREAPYIDPDPAPDPSCLDGAEVFNYGNLEDELVFRQEYESRYGPLAETDFYGVGQEIGYQNLHAAQFARKHRLIPLSGADVHRKDYPGIGQAGMAFPERITSAKDLVQALREGKGKLIVNGKILP